MYLIHIPAARAGFDHWLYFDEDPRPKGCTHQVVADVEFHDLDPGDAARPGSSLTRMPVLARAETAHCYKVFPSKLSVPFDYELLDGFAFRFPTWEEFMETPIAKDGDWRMIQ
jgi:hypothetical protein